MSFLKACFFFPYSTIFFLCILLWTNQIQSINTSYNVERESRFFLFPIKQYIGRILESLRPRSRILFWHYFELLFCVNAP